MQNRLAGTFVGLFVAPKPDSTPEESDILGLCTQELAEFKVPKRVLIRESLAMSRVGKVDRAQLQQEVFDLLKQRNSESRRSRSEESG